MAGIDDKRAFVPVQIAILTVSDTRSESDDRSGATLVERAEGAGHKVVRRMIVPDDRARIEDALRGFIADPEVDVVIATGGTGLTGRDVTPEAFRAVYEKEIEGFGELFRWLSYKHVGRVDDPVARHRGRGPGHVPVRTARFAVRVPRRLGRDPRAAARQPLPALQFRRVDAAARRALSCGAGPAPARLANRPPSAIKAPVSLAVFEQVGLGFGKKRSSKGSICASRSTIASA